MDEKVTTIGLTNDERDLILAIREAQSLLAEAERNVKIIQRHKKSPDRIKDTIVQSVNSNPGDIEFIATEFENHRNLFAWMQRARALFAKLTNDALPEPPNVCPKCRAPIHGRNCTRCDYVEF